MYYINLSNFHLDTSINYANNVLFLAARKFLAATDMASQAQVLTDN
jgi:hypothetical protein